MIFSRVPPLSNQIPYHLVHPLNCFLLFLILSLQPFDFLIQLFNGRRQTGDKLSEIIFPMRLRKPGCQRMVGYYAPRQKLIAHDAIQIHELLPPHIQKLHFLRTFRTDGILTQAMKCVKTAPRTIVNGQLSHDSFLLKCNI